MKENLALDKYKDNVFPGALLIGLNCGPKEDISAEHNGNTLAPPPLSRPFSNASIFKEVPTEATPPPDSKLNPQWYQLEDAEHRAVDGEVLAAFELIDITQSNFKRPQINPPCKMIKKWAHVITLGLRDIQSTIGVNKPFIEFECNGSMYSTEKSNMPSSRNPNFCQILKLEVTLPEQTIFLPNLNLTIKDSVCILMLREFTFLK